MDDSELRSRWTARILPIVFENCAPSSDPVTIFLGGQPGAGKTAAQAQLLQRSGESIVPIVGDDYRRFHPEYTRLVNENPAQMPHVTANASAAWIAMSVDYANRNRISSLIEGTWRNAATVLDEARRAKSLGRHTHAAIVSVPPTLSALGTLNRFYVDRARGLPARWTPISAHEIAVTNLPQTVSEILNSPDIDEFTVMNRSGIPLWTGVPNDAGLSAFTSEFTRRLTRNEINSYRSQLDAVERSYHALKDNNTEAKALINRIKRTFDYPQATLTAADMRHELSTRIAAKLSNRAGNRDSSRHSPQRDDRQPPFSL